MLQQKYLFKLGIKINVSLSIRREMICPFYATFCTSLVLSLEEH